MGAIILPRSLFFLFCLLLISDSSFGKKPPLKAIRQNKKLDLQENKIFSSASEITSQLDTIPVINPTTPPTTSTPIINPTNPPPNTAPTVNPPIPPIPPSPIPTLPITPPTSNTPGSSGGSWCIVSPTASDTALQVALDYACGLGGADCAAIQPGAPCYNPNTLRDHASYAFNDYYQKNPAPTSCSFGGTAQLTSTDPSSGSCRYASSRGMRSPTPPGMPPPTPPSAPTGYGNIPSAPSIYNEPTGYEPTATPSSAEKMSCSLLLFFVSTCVTASLAAAKYP